MAPSNKAAAADIIVDDPNDLLVDPSEVVLVKKTAKRFVAVEPDMSGWSHENQLLFRLVVDILNGAIIVRATTRPKSLEHVHAERLREAFCSIRWSREKITWVTTTIVQVLPRCYSKFLSKLYSMLKKHIPPPLHDRLVVDRPPRKRDDDSD